MKRIGSGTKCALAVAIAAMLAVAPAMADKPPWAGGSKADRDERMGKPDDRSERSSPVGSRHDHFEERHRQSVRDYYREQHRQGHCPPGLAKKENGCLPPGQAKKWQVGQPLPRDVIFHEVPRPLASQLGQPPSGYRYVRVASDILLMANRTGTIADAILSLGAL